MYCQTSISVQFEIGKRGCSRPVAAGVVQVPQFGALVLRVPLAELVAEAHDALLGAGLFPRRGGRRRCRRRSRIPRWPRAASPTGACCAIRSGCFSTTVPRFMESRPSARSGARPVRRRACRGTRRLPGSCGRCRCISGKGNCRAEGLFGDAQHADRVLPPEKSSTGLLHWPATSRMMWMASD